MWERVIQMKTYSKNLLSSFYLHAFRAALRDSASKSKIDLPVPPSLLKHLGAEMNKKYDDPLCTLFVRKKDILNGGV